MTQRTISLGHLLLEKHENQLAFVEPQAALHPTPGNITGCGAGQVSPILPRPADPTFLTQYFLYVISIVHIAMLETLHW